MRVSVLLMLALVPLCLSKAVELTDKDFDAFLVANPRTVVMFYAKWCGHCKTFKKTYDALADTLAASNEPEGQVKVARIDADKYGDIGEKYKVRGFPTFKYFNDGVTSNFQRGKVASMIEQLKYFSLPVFTQFQDEAAFEAAKDQKDIWVVYRGKQEGELYNKLYKLAEKKKRGKVGFSTIQGQDTPSLTMYRNFDEREVVFEDKSDQLKKFLDFNSLPQLFEHNRELKDALPKADIPRLYIVSEEQEKKNEAKALLQGLVSLTKGKMQLAYTSDKKIYKQLWSMMGGNYKALIEFMPSKGDSEEYVIEEPHSLENVKRQVELYLEGKLAKHYKSQPIPEESRQSAFRDVVYSTFQKEVMEESQDKDVVVMYHAPWCGACKQAKPIMLQLAKEAKDKMPRVLFKKYDAENNAAQIDLQYYPTVVMYQKGSMKKIKSFSRAKFIAFYEKHGSFEWTEFDKEKKARQAKMAREAARQAKKKEKEEAKRKAEEAKQEL